MNVAQRWCDGRIPTCSMSGFVSTTLAFLRAHARSSVSVSPSKVTARRPGNEPRPQRAELVVGERLRREDQQRGVAPVGRRPTRRSAPGSTATSPTRCPSRRRRSCRRGAGRSRRPGARRAGRCRVRRCGRETSAGSGRRQIGELRPPGRARTSRCTSRPARSGSAASASSVAHASIWGEGTDRLRRPAVSLVLEPAGSPVFAEVVRSTNAAATVESALSLPDCMHSVRAQGV